MRFKEAVEHAFSQEAAYARHLSEPVRVPVRFAAAGSVGRGYGRAFAHAKQGWETFTKAALEYAVQQSTAPLAAVLWGKPAQK